MNETVPTDTPDSIRGEIASLEERIEALTDELARSRKIAFAAKAAIIAGAIWLAAILFGFVFADGLTLMVAAILILGGIVLSGSNARTAEDTTAQIAEAERERAALIGEIELTVVTQPGRTLH
jgi:small neutral amino acid transporter SnatA (MarC family)